MANKIVGFVISFAAVLAAYGVYALTVVPLIEPATRAETTAVGYEPGEIVDEILSPEVKALFPADAWERTSTKVLETTTGLLLFKEYEQLPEGGLKVSPLTIVIQKGETTNRTVILRADKGANLQFDEETNLSGHKMGRLKRARLLGQVAITSPASKPGIDDAFSIRTSYVQIDDQKIWTGNDVAFQFGPNFGSGRDLTIALRPRAKTKINLKENPLASVQSLTLAYVERVQFAVEDFDFFQSESKPKAAASSVATSPAVLTCRGPFRFDVLQMRASFEHSVIVEKRASPTIVDSLHADRLEVHLSETTTTHDGEKKTKWEIARLKATGQPVQLNVPSQSASANGRYFEYDFLHRQITLEDNKQVVLRHQGRQIAARQLVYALGADNEIGRLIAKGPGVFSGFGAGNDRGQHIAGNWGNKLQLRPNEGKQVLSLSGGARLQLSANANSANSLAGANFASDTLHVWLVEDQHSPPKVATNGKKETPRLTPEIVSAIGNVHVESPQLIVDTNQLEAYIQFEQGPSPTQIEQSANTGIQSFTNRSTRSERASKFKAFAKVVRINMLKFSDNTLLERVNLTGNAEVVETQTPNQGELPLHVTGHSIDISSAHSEQAELHVLGKPAKFAARGVTIVGSNLHANRGYNRLWMTGPGEIQLPAPRNLGGGKTTGSQTMRVVYLDGLDFDGQLLRCHQEVKITGEGQFALADTLAVELNQKILFGESVSSVRPEAVRFALEGGVFLENRSFRGKELTSIDRIKGETLTLDRTTGELNSQGPGWVSSVRRGSGNWLAKETSATTAPTGNELVFLRNEFQREMVGNMNRREIEFRAGVRTTYGPVASWNEILSADRPGGLGEQGVQMTCDKLRVFEFGPQVTPDRRAIEVEATSNVYIEGRDYSARANRVSFVEAKQMVVLEGDARTDAELVRRDPRTGSESKAAAGKIKFWPKRDAFHVDDARYLDLSNLPGS